MGKWLKTEKINNWYMYFFQDSNGVHVYAGTQNDPPTNVFSSCDYAGSYNNKKEAVKYLKAHSSNRF